MPQTLENLSRRMATLRNIRGVVRTMEALSRVNAAPYNRAAASIEAYHHSVLEGLHIFARSKQQLSAASTKPAAKKIVIVFGSDHGLCGGYNESVAEAASNYSAGEKGAVLAVGAKMTDALKMIGLTVADQLTPPASADGIGRLASEILVCLDGYRASMPAGDIAVTLIYMQQAQGGQQSPRVQQLLPLDPEFLSNLALQPWKSRSLPVLLMPPDEIFSALIRNHLFASLFKSAAEAIASENSARLVLMQQAERAIDDRYGEMVQSYQSVRQSEITSELMDVITGFEALSRKRDTP